MDAELKRKWIEALRSGEFKQCKGALHDGAEGFCCLGVLGSISGVSRETLYSRREQMQPISHLFPSISDDAWTVAGMNDDGKTFPEIADWIEKNIPTA